MTLLEAELEKARKDLAAMQLLVTKTIGSEDDETEEIQVKMMDGNGKGKGKGKAVERDDDTHYFHSYEENGAIIASASFQRYNFFANKAV